MSKTTNKSTPAVGLTETRNLTNTMLCWNPSGDVRLVPWPARGMGKELRMSIGACDSEISNANFEQRKAHAFIEAMHLIIRDGCDSMAVHRALLGLEEYRAGLAPELLP